MFQDWRIQRDKIGLPDANMDQVDDDARFFVEEMLDDDAFVGAAEGMAQHCPDQNAGGGEVKDNGTSVQPPAPVETTAISTDSQETAISMPSPEWSPAEFNAATAYGSMISDNDSKPTRTTQINDNSHNNVNITNVYHQAHVRREDEEDTKRHGNQPQGVEANWHEAGATSITANHCQMPQWLRFPTWAIRLTLWLLKGLQAPITWGLRLCLGLVFQGVAGILLLLVMALVGLWTLKWWWLQVWSLSYTAAMSPLSATSTSLWLWLSHAMKTLHDPFKQTTSSSSSPSDYSTSSTAPSQTDSDSVTKTLSSAMLSVSSVILWGDGYMRVAGSIVSRCGTQASLFNAPLATAKSVLPRIEEIHTSTIAFKDRINAQLAIETQRARRLERKVRQASLQKMLKNQEAEAREAYKMQFGQRGRYCSGPETSGWLSSFPCSAWQRLWPTPVKPQSSKLKLKTHSILEKWLDEELSYMESVLQARLEWEIVYEEMADDKATQRLGRVWCQISEASKKQRQRDWNEGGSGPNGHGKGLGVQLADIESASQIACLAHGPMGDHLQQRLSKLKENTLWLEERMNEIRLGPLVSLQGRRGASYKDSVGSGDDDGKEASYLSRVLLTADELQAIRDLITDTLVLQEHFNTEMFTVYTVEMPEGVS